MNDLAPVLQRFFTDKLMLQRQANPHTIIAYRDTFKLLLGFVQQSTGRHPARLSIADLDAVTISKFLEHLQTDRGNTTSTRNARLGAIHSFFGYAALHAPEHAGLIQRVWPSHPNISIVPSSVSSRKKRATPSSVLPTCPHGSVAATTPC